jgi:hypothetical protein
MRIEDVKINEVYMFSKQGNEVRVKALPTTGPDTGLVEVEFVTSGKAVMVTAGALERVGEYEDE